MSHVFARCASQKTHGHARITRVSENTLTCDNHTRFECRRFACCFRFEGAHKLRPVCRHRCNAMHCYSQAQVWTSGPPGGSDLATRNVIRQLLCLARLGSAAYDGEQIEEESMLQQAWKPGSVPALVPGSPGSLPVPGDRQLQGDQRTVTDIRRMESCQCPAHVRPGAPTASSQTSCAERRRANLNGWAGLAGPRVVGSRR